MLIKCIRAFLDVKTLREDLRRLGVNFITAGLVGIFINHFVGTTLSIMFISSVFISFFGIMLMVLGLLKGKSSHEHNFN